MKKSRVLVSVIMTVAFIFSVGATMAVAADAIKVGVVLPLTGKLAKFGEIENKFSECIIAMNVA